MSQQLFKGYTLTEVLKGKVAEGDEREVMEALAKEVARQNMAACMHFRGDGTYEVLESPEAVLERRQADAMRLLELEGEVERLRRA